MENKPVKPDKKKNKIDFAKRKDDFHRLINTIKLYKILK